MMILLLGKNLFKLLFLLDYYRVFIVFNRLSRFQSRFCLHVDYVAASINMKLEFSSHYQIITFMF